MKIFCIFFEKLNMELNKKILYDPYEGIDKEYFLKNLLLIISENDRLTYQKILKNVIINVFEEKSHAFNFFIHYVNPNENYEKFMNKKKNSNYQLTTLAMLSKKCNNSGFQNFIQKNKDSLYHL